MCYTSCYQGNTFNQKVADWIFARNQLSIAEKSLQAVESWFLPQRAGWFPDLKHAMVVSFRMAAVGLAFFSVVFTGAALHAVGEQMENNKKNSSLERFSGTAIKGVGYLMMHSPRILFHRPCDSWWHHRHCCHW